MDDCRKLYDTLPGQRYPFGCTRDGTGVNFVVWGGAATSVELLLFENAASPEPVWTVQLDPEINRTYFWWHIYVKEVPPGTFYAWRMDGSHDTWQAGYRYDKDKALLDPRARAVSDLLWRRKDASIPGDNICTSLRAIVVDSEDYDWEGDCPLRVPLKDMVIYEMHVGGFTRHAGSGVAYPGTFSGVTEKIPHLKALGVNAVELLPLMAFDEQDVPPRTAALGLRNYWGYSTHSFFAPHSGYTVSGTGAAQVNEFRDMVKALHRAGISVIMDVVFNHTAEGGAEGPTINFKGIDNPGFYHVDPSAGFAYRDYTGCGNTVNCNNPVISRFIIDCLEYWVEEMHVDGFRFDLASVLVRDVDGVPRHHAPMPWLIEFSETLRNTHIIAEAWDAAGLYQVGGFPGFRWAEWNGRYRDVIRRFVKGDRGLISETATRVAGSSDLYQDDRRLPGNSINFVTCHDGFTLWDLVSYNGKHNEANGEENRDGSPENFSDNCGAEGKTDDPSIIALRLRRAKNSMATLMLSQGVPMILFGDEVLRTQEGNNNCYCQDNELGWMNWDSSGMKSDMFRFTSGIIALRMRHPCLRRREFLKGVRHAGGRFPDITWHGRKLGEPPWNDQEDLVLAFTLAAEDPGEEDLHVIFNMSPERIDVSLPEPCGRKWHCAVDTGLAAPADITAREDQAPVPGATYPVAPGSVVVFENR